MFLKGRPEEKGVQLQQIQTVPINVETIREVRRPAQGSDAPRRRRR